MSRGLILVGIVVLHVLSAPGVAGTSDGAAVTSTDNTTNTTKEVLVWSDTHVGNGETVHGGRTVKSDLNATLNWIGKNPGLDYSIHGGDVTDDSDPQNWSEAADYFDNVSKRTGIRRTMWTTGSAHDGFRDGASSSSTDGGQDYGHNQLDYLDIEGQGTLVYSFEIGNTAFISVPTYSEPGSQYYVSDIWLDWAEKKLEEYQGTGHNIVLYSHYPLYMTNQQTDGEWWGTDVSEWKETTARIKGFIRDYDVDMYLGSHVHTDADSFDTTTSAKGGKIVDGSEFSDLPNATYVSTPVINWQHGQEAGEMATHPGVYTMNMTEGKRYLEFRAYNTFEHERVHISVDNSSETKSAVRVSVDHPIRDLPENSNRIDNFDPGWFPKDLSRKDQSVTLFDSENGLNVQGGGWSESEWNYSDETVVVETFNVTHSGVSPSVEVTRGALDRPVSKIATHTSYGTSGTVQDISPVYRARFDSMRVTRDGNQYRLSDFRNDYHVELYDDMYLTNVTGVPIHLSNGTTLKTDVGNITAVDGEATFVIRDNDIEVKSGTVDSDPDYSTSTPTPVFGGGSNSLTP